MLRIRFDRREEFGTFVKVNSSDSYSFGVVRFVIAWMIFMEKEIGDGDPSEIIPKVYEKYASEADTDGITGFMYEAAVHFISDLWQYGDIFKSAVGTVV